MAKHGTDPVLEQLVHTVNESGHNLHVRAAGRDEGLWRISLESVDGWTVGASAVGGDDKGPFARLLGT
jgi:hypothetical protein